MALRLSVSFVGLLTFLILGSGLTLGAFFFVPPSGLPTGGDAIASALTPFLAPEAVGGGSSSLGALCGERGGSTNPPLPATPPTILEGSNPAGKPLRTLPPAPPLATLGADAAAVAGDFSGVEGDLSGDGTTDVGLLPPTFGLLAGGTPGAGLAGGPRLLASGFGLGVSSSLLDESSALLVSEASSASCASIA